MQFNSYSLDPGLPGDANKPTNYAAEAGLRLQGVLLLHLQVIPTLNKLPENFSQKIKITALPISNTRHKQGRRRHQDIFLLQISGNGLQNSQTYILSRMTLKVGTLI